MKLRNKKTGQIVNIECITLFESTTLDDTFESFDEFYSLTKLNEEWEDCEPKEPLIKDEKIRKAVRSWADAETIPPEETVFYNADEHSLGWYRSVIEFSKHIQDLKEDDYTIAELCGEEKLALRPKKLADEEFVEDSKYLKKISW